MFLLEITDDQIIEDIDTFEDYIINHKYSDEEDKQVTLIQLKACYDLAVKLAPNPNK